MRSLFPILIGLATLASPVLHAAEAKRVTIADYFLQLPGKTFEDE